MDSKSKKNPKDTDLKQTQPPPIPFGKKTETPIEEINKNRGKILQLIKKEGRLTLDEANFLIEDMKKKEKYLRETFKDFTYKLGYTEEYIKSYFENPSNFTPEKWQKIQKKKDEFLENFNSGIMEGKSLTQALGESFKLDKMEANPTKEEEKPPKKFMRKPRSGWLPMK